MTNGQVMSSLSVWYWFKRVVSWRIGELELEYYYCLFNGINGHIV